MTGSNSQTYSLDAKRVMVAFTVLLTLAVIGFVINGVWSAGQSVSADYKIKQSMQQLATITLKLRSYSTQGYIEENIGQGLIAAGIIPTEMVQGQTIHNVWGGEVTFNAVGAKERKDQFALTYRNIPPLDCLLFIKRIGDQAKQFSIYGIATGAGQLLLEFPVSEGITQKACKYDQNLLALIFKLNG